MFSALTLVTTLKLCGGELTYFKLVDYQETDTEDGATAYFGHSYVLAPNFCFIDDLFCQASLYPGPEGETEKWLIEAQSQLVIGKDDLQKNYRNVKQFYECLSTHL